MASPILGPISNLVNNDYQYQPPTSAQSAQITIPALEAEKRPQAVQDTDESAKKNPTGRRSDPANCETCKRRKYQDGSDENVSFKSPAHVGPNAAGAAVRAHEQEHVNNAYTKASQKNGKVLSAVVSIHTAVCPECGRTYVAGGTTNTKIKYYNDDNAYGKSKNFENAQNFNGSNVDFRG
ncbi:MAG: hypothetical protein MJ107_03365 [Lachnospiraceae bacterium]|nr:hypothetical protein [Lachnospiraceae bacterium]